MNDADREELLREFLKKPEDTSTGPYATGTWKNATSEQILNDIQLWKDQIKQDPWYG